MVFLLFFNSEEGQVRKILKAEPLPDGSGHFFNLSTSLLLVSTLSRPNLTRVITDLKPD